jgi:hypothetical protein
MKNECFDIAGKVFAPGEYAVLGRLPAPNAALTGPIELHRWMELQEYERKNFSTAYRKKMA